MVSEESNDSGSASLQTGGGILMGIVLRSVIQPCLAGVSTPIRVLAEHVLTRKICRPMRLKQRWLWQLLAQLYRFRRHPSSRAR